jgi:hypothetical protein
MLRRTSKRVKEVVDKPRMRLPVVRLCRSFWNDTRNGTAAEKLQLVMRQLTVATARCRIITLKLPHCDMKGQDAGVAGVLAQTEILAEVLGQCVSLAHLDLKGNRIGVVGGGRFRASWCGQASGLELGNWRTCLPASVSNRDYSLQLVASCTFSRRVTRHASAGSELDLLVCDA